MSDQPDPESSGLLPRGPVARALTVLQAVADADEAVQVNALAREVGLSASTVHRMLGLLVEEGWVQQSARDLRYSVGPAFYRVAARVTGKMPLTTTARPFIEAIADKFGETTLLGLYLPQESSLAFIARADGTHPLQYRIAMNEPLSLAWGASGKVILAHLPETVVLAILEREGPSPATGARPPSFDDLQGSLESIKQQGYASTTSEKLPGARGVAAPVFDANGVLGSLVITGPQDRMPAQDDELIAAVTATAQELSAVLAGTAPPQKEVDL